MEWLFEEDCRYIYFFAFASFIHFYPDSLSQADSFDIIIKRAHITSQDVNRIDYPLKLENPLSGSDLI